MYIVTVHRTQIYLDDAQYRVLRNRARREGKSMAALIREILDAQLARATPPGAQDPFDAVIGIGEGEGEAVAENTEDYLYGPES